MFEFIATKKNDVKLKFEIKTSNKKKIIHILFQLHMIKSHDLICDQKFISQKFESFKNKFFRIVHRFDFFSHVIFRISFEFSHENIETMRHQIKTTFIQFIFDFDLRALLNRINDMNSVWITITSSTNEKIWKINITLQIILQSKIVRTSKWFQIWMSIEIKNELYKRYNDLNSFSFSMIVDDVVLKICSNFSFVQRRRDVWRSKKFSCWWRQLTNWNIFYQIINFVVVDFEKIRFEINAHFNDFSINRRRQNIATIRVI